MIKVKVLRILNGGEFNPGDEREMTKAEAAPLIETGAIELIEDAVPAPEAKAELPIENKMEAAPAKKAIKAPRGKAVN